MGKGKRRKRGGKKCRCERCRQWRPRAAEGDLRGAILGVTEAYDNVTFPFAMRLLRPYFEVDGGAVVAVPSDPNVWLWANMAIEFAQEVVEMMAAGDIALVPGRIIDHVLLDEQVLPLPPVGGPRKEGYPEPHWLPVFLKAPGKLTQEERLHLGMATN